jgi:predicted AAA+ superfamily ATPase
MKSPFAQNRLKILNASSRGRFTVLTGARQVGKSTLVGMAFPGVPLLRFDSLAERTAYEALTPADWIARYPCAILDEVQKAPRIFETLKSCYDQNPDLRYVLLGSSQVILNSAVRIGQLN